ncbi:hypothetical protein JCM8547_006552 [Rhodosporidiobolus lusitaniae]
MSSQLLLGTPITFPGSDKVAQSRTLKSTERLAAYSDKLDERGIPGEKLVRLYSAWSEGGLGLIITGNIPIDRTGLEAKGNVIIDAKSPWNPVEHLKPLIAAAKAHGSLVIGQLTHGGRQTPIEVNPQPVSSSDVQAPPSMGLTFGKPRPLEVSEIDDLIKAWGYGAKVLYEAGADGAQLHSAHGYLLSQFLSGRVNQRTDEYGGPLENRARIVRRVVEEIKKQVPDPNFLLSIKINSQDFADKGLTLEESKEVCKWLDEAGLHLIELSGGTYESWAVFDHKSEHTKNREAYFVEFADAIKPAIKHARLAVTGGFRSKKGMEEALHGSTDIVGLARPLTSEPHLIRDILEGRTEGAKENKVPASKQTTTCIYSMRCMANGQPLPDLSDKATAEATLAAALGQKPEDKPAGEGHDTTQSYEKGNPGGLDAEEDEV